MMLAHRLGTSIAISGSSHNDNAKFKRPGHSRGPPWPPGDDCVGIFNNHPVNYRNDDVLAAFGLAPISVECCVQRLNFDKAVAMDADNHLLWISAMFGVFPNISNTHCFVYR